MDIKKRILLVDDDKDILYMGGLSLSRAGYVALRASNGQDAISIAKDQHPDLILLDIKMPHMSGIKVAEALAQDDSTKDIPIKFLSSLVDTEEIRKSNLGPLHFIPKSYSPQQLVEVVAKHFEAQA